MTSNLITCGFEEAENGLPQGDRYQYQQKLRKYRDLLEKLNNEGKDDDIVLEYHNSTCYRSDLKNLEDECWLSDNNILFVYEYLRRNLLAKQPNHGGVTLLSPSMAFLLRHSEEPPEEILKVLPPLEGSQYVIMPINDNPHVEKAGGGAHWSLVVLNLENYKVYHFDTAGNCNQTAAYQTATRLSTVLLACDVDTKTEKRSSSESANVRSERKSPEQKSGDDEKSNSSSSIHLPHIPHPHIHRKKSKAQHMDFENVSTPQQTNGYDCGVFLCEITGYLLRRIVFSKKFEESVSGLKNVTFEPISGREYILSVMLDFIVKAPGPDPVSSN